MRILYSIEEWGIKRGGIFLLIAVPVFVLFIPVLVGRADFTSGFSYTWIEQFFHFYKNSITQGDSILWNPLVFSGFPQWISLTGGIFSPFTYMLVRIFPVSIAYGALIFLHVVFAGYWTALLLRRLGVSVVGSVMGGFAFIMNQWLLIPELPLASALPYLPLLFLALLAIARREKTILYFFLGSLAILLMWFSGHWHYVVEILFAAGFFAVYLSFTKAGNLKERIRPLVLYGAMVLLGTIIGSIQLIPTFTYIGLSARTGFDHLQAVQGGFLPADGISAFLPHFIVPAVSSAPWIFYIGALALFFFCYGCTNKFKSFPGFFTLLALGSLLLSINNSFLFWMLHHLPFMKLLHSANRWIVILAFATSVLAGIGYDRFINAARSEKKYSILYKTFAWITGVLTGTAVALTVSTRLFGSTLLDAIKSFFAAHFYNGRQLPIETYYGYLETGFYYLTRSFDLMRGAVLFPLLFLVLALVLLRMRERLVAKGIFPLLVCIFVVLNFELVFAFSGTTTSRAMLNSVPETAAMLLKQADVKILPLFLKKGAARFLTDEAAESETARLTFYRSMLAPNINTMYGIPSVEYMDEIASRRMNRLLSVFRELPQDDEVSLQTASKLWSFTGVTHVLSPFPITHSSLKKIFETSILPPYNIPLMIYENPAARPRFYFASPVSHIAEDELKAFELLKTMPDSPRGVFVECPREAPEIICTDSEMPGFDGEGTITLETKKNTESVLKTTSDEPQLLVFSENNLPGWKAYIDEKEVPLLMVGSVYMGIIVPPGTHEVRFEFSYGTILEEFWKQRTSK